MNRSTLRMITLLARKSQMYMGVTLKNKYNITAAEQPFFMALQRCERVTQEELTAMVCVDKAVTTRVVKSLEGKGYLTRVKDTQDRRQNRIYPTTLTRELGAAVQKDLLMFNDAVTQGISGEELEVVQKALIKMEENMVKLLAGKSGQDKEQAAKWKGDADNVRK
ncbi:MarR family winged helix-turn-helix transcriptional regulator [Frisingicoccus sp.]|uniref:MarR family winged helix-turn-helix transcriptional regulator n=1 Tax=Frisingicoccus sp. TaxID=1918627 RepID=UPI00399A9636